MEALAVAGVCLTRPQVAPCVAAALLGVLGSLIPQGHPVVSASWLCGHVGLPS